MTSGGARAVSGPPPDPSALRRDRAADKAGWTTLPAAGRTGQTPQWPLVNVQAREWDLWESLWARPQAVMWERLGQEIEVAMFCRKLAEAELPKASVELQKVVRQYLDSLGMSVQGMLRNRWRIAANTETEAAPAGPARRTARQPGPRDRLKVVPYGEGS